MEQITTLDSLQKKINTGEPVLVYFSGENCSVCTALKPKVIKEVKENFPKISLYEVQTNLYNQIASHFTVFSIPTILVFFDTKEFKRVGRNISVSLFVEELKRPYNLFMK